jgi:hypothetical protein
VSIASAYEVLPIGLHDLQFEQEEVGERESAGVELESVVDLDRVAHFDTVEEHVDLSFVERIPEEQTAHAVNGVERLVRGVAKCLEESRGFAPLPGAADEVDGSSSLMTG